MGIAARKALAIGNEKPRSRPGHRFEVLLPYPQFPHTPKASHVE
uniref:Uncharacterized protein n=1 Tax=Arundo donax TaxID=35708 RepID=A0A0A8XTH8_ARUDO